jgi:SLT domain-containing protein
VKLVPVANQAFRLNELHDLYKKAKKAKNMKLAADLLEQIAREVGGVLTNSRELNINDARRAKDMTPEDRRTMLGSIIAEELAKKRDGEQPTTH